MQDSGFDDRRLSSDGTSNAGKENASPQKRGARKSLAANWAPQPLARLEDSSFTNPETPSKSLLGTDNSMVFSPPSALKDTMNQSIDSGNSDHGEQDSMRSSNKTPSHSASEQSPQQSKVSTVNYRTVKQKLRWHE